MNLNLEVNGLTKRYKDSDFYLDNVSFSKRSNCGIYWRKWGW